MGIRQQEKSDLTRSELSEAMVRLFLKKGYDSTTIKDITEKAGYSVGSFYRHWRSKGEAFAMFWDGYVSRYIQGSIENAPLSGPADEVLDYLIRRSEQFANSKLTIKLYNTSTALGAKFKYPEIISWSERFTYMLLDFVRANTACTDERRLMSATYIINTILNTHAMQNALKMPDGYDIDNDTLAISIMAILRNLDNPAG